VEWFKNLSDAEKIAIIVPVGLAAVGGLFALCKWLFRNKKDPDLALVIIDETLKDNKQLRQTVKELEKRLAKPSVEANIGSEQSTPVPSAEAKELANVISEDDGVYAQALKAIAEGDNEKAECLLDETQEFLDTVQQRKDEVQAKIYMARMQNASYAGRPQDALQYCDKLTSLAGNDSLIINNMAMVYYENAKYKEAEPLMQRVVKILENPGGQPLPNYAGVLNNMALLYQATNRLVEAEPLMERALKIDETSFGKDHPKVAIRLNNLAQLYQATNRLKEAEPLMERALKIVEASLDKDHPKVAFCLNNLAGLYWDTNRLKEAEPLMKRALKIDEASLGEDHPKVAIRLNNLAQLYQDTNRLKEAEPMYKRALVILIEFTRRTGHRHPHLDTAIKNYSGLLGEMGIGEDEVKERVKRLGPEMF